MSVKCQRDISPYLCWQQAATFKLRRITSLLTAMSWNCPLRQSLLVPGPPPRSKRGHYLLPYEALLKLFHVEKILPSCTGSFVRYTFSSKGSVECSSDDINHRRHCSPIWDLRVTVDNSGVLTLPDVWHIPPGRAGVLLLNSDKNATRAPKRKEWLWTKDSPLLSSPLLPPVQSGCVRTVHFLEWSLALCPSYWFLKDGARWVSTCQSNRNRAGKTASRTPGICTKI